MKQGTKYAKLMKQAFSRLQKDHGKPEQGELTDLLDQILLGIMSRGTTQAEAAKALGRIGETVVDRNELRVSAPRELLEAIGKQFPMGLEKARAINAALNGIFNREHNLDLGELRNKPKREAREYLQTLPGIDPYTVASTMLLSVGGHAVPVDDTMLAFFRQESLVDAAADVAEVQAFLEHNIAAADAYAFYTLMRDHAAKNLKVVEKPTTAAKKTAKKTTKKATTKAIKKTAKTTATKKTGAAKTSTTKKTAKAAKKGKA